MIFVVFALSASLMCIAPIAGAGAAAGPDLPIAWHQEEASLSLLGPVSVGLGRQVTSAKMLRTFGKTSRTRVRYGACQRYWRKYGMTAWFMNLGFARKGICKQKRASLQWLTIGPAPTVDWHTTEGLRIGDSLARLVQLYPDSKEFDLVERLNWSLSPTYFSPFGDNAETADVMARVEDDTVVAFDIWVGGAGE